MHFICLFFVRSLRVIIVQGVTKSDSTEAYNTARAVLGWAYTNQLMFKFLFNFCMLLNF